MEIKIQKSHPNRYQKHIAWSFGDKLVCVDDKFSKPFKSCLDKDAVYKFINSVIEESKYCSVVMKKPFNKVLVMDREDNEDLQNSFKCLICDNSYVDDDVTVRDHSHIIRK